MRLDSLECVLKLSDGRAVADVATLMLDALAWRGSEEKEEKDALEPKPKRWDADLGGGVGCQAESALEFASERTL